MQGRGWLVSVRPGGSGPRAGRRATDGGIEIRACAGMAVSGSGFRLRQRVAHLREGLEDPFGLRTRTRRADRASAAASAARASPHATRMTRVSSARFALKYARRPAIRDSARAARRFRAGEKCAVMTASCGNVPGDARDRDRCRQAAADVGGRGFHAAFTTVGLLRERRSRSDRSMASRRPSVSRQISATAGSSGSIGTKNPIAGQVPSSTGSSESRASSWSSMMPARRVRRRSCCSVSRACPRGGLAHSLR